ncbi:MAG: N-acetylmuramoyl-L-alanine amidase [Campylobacterales bacterium]|nr:N-acetylmuramoyl-L-alanine amidase [Campylobacterales bacterium]
MIKAWLLLVACYPLLWGDAALERAIGRMVIVGFDALSLERNATLLAQIKRYDLGGVILFDRDYRDRTRPKNVRDPQQLQALCSILHEASKGRMFIMIDQEGGRVERLKARDGFVHTPSAAQMAALPVQEARAHYDVMAAMLREAGITLNAAPVVDLAVNPDNPVIAKLERAYSSDPVKVGRYATAMLDAMSDKGVVGVLKHFPGHGSSRGDSHEGFVDVTQTWTPQELEPYAALIQSGKAQAIMSAHVFNRTLDPDVPATLSYKINTQLLRHKLGFKGVLISDDLQMKAISAHYSLKESLRRAINSGVDMLLFGNQLAYTPLPLIIETIKELIEDKEVPRERIEEANRRIEALHVHRTIRLLPIDFGPEREALSRAYIKAHYGLHVEDARIEPRMIVIHWTATKSLEEAYARLKPERLLKDRGDIAASGALNVSAHFLVDRDGTIYRLMDERTMARHVIGLNYHAIGIENVGGEGNEKEDLTPAQLETNARLVGYLQSRFEGIEYLIGHHEYQQWRDSPLWLERDQAYITHKRDPGDAFMRDLRSKTAHLGLRSRYR